MSPEAGKSIAAAFALAGFAIATVSGLSVDNPVTRTLQCALVSMVLCYFAGLIVGTVALRIVSDHVEAFNAASAGGEGSGAAPEKKDVHGAGSP